MNPTAEEREQMTADGIVCILCRYYGLAHHGDHMVPSARRPG